LLGNRALACDAQPKDRALFKECREAASGLSPGELYREDSVLVALATRRRSMQDRTVLEHVEVPPSPLALMIIEPTRLPARWTRPFFAAIVVKMHMNLTLLEGQINTVDLPRVDDAQEVTENLRIVHPKGCDPGAVRPSIAHYDSSRPVFIKFSRHVMKGIVRIQQRNERAGIDEETTFHDASLVRIDREIVQRLLALPGKRR